MWILSSGKQDSTRIFSLLFVRFNKGNVDTVLKFTNKTKVYDSHKLIGFDYLTLVGHYW